MSFSATRALWVLAVVAVLIAVIATKVASLGKSPSYGGRSVQSWAKLLWAGTPSEQDDATKAFQSLGTNATPELTRMLRKKDSILRTKFLDLAEKQTLVRYPYMDRDLDHRRIALKATSVLGESARPLVPVLEETIQNWRNESLDIVQEASRIAKMFAPESTPELIIGNGPPYLAYPTKNGSHP